MRWTRVSVLVEALSVVGRREVLEKKYPGGVSGYERDCPNRTFCADDHLVRAGFMVPDDVRVFVESLATHGIVHLRHGKAVDIVVVDQFQGPTSPCDWIEGGRHPDGYSAVWLAGTIPGWFAHPVGWSPEQSARMNFASNEEVKERLLGLATRDGVDMVLDFKTGREGYIGRTKPPREKHDSGEGAGD